MEHQGTTRPPLLEAIGRRNSLTLHRINFNIRETTTSDGSEPGYEWDSAELIFIDRSSVIDAIVRSRYTADRMEAVINNYLLDPTGQEAKADFEAMQQWRAKAKEWAAQIVERSAKLC